MATLTETIKKVKNRYGIIGDSQALLGAIERAVKVAPIDLSVLIIGESGTGKEHFPRIIHDNSPRRHNKYIAVNCGAIPEGTIDSELFGHVKGSFTGAIGDHKGYFEEAKGGTLFLDEVAEMPLSTQARLLRVLENGEFMKVGSSVVEKTNVRIVAATNKDMLRAVQSGKFREDLYYRLSTVLITVPPLRERGRDILLLTRKFMQDFAETYGTEEILLDESAAQALTRFGWPGNVRQLKSVVEQMALFEAGHRLSGAVIKSYLPHRQDDQLVPVGDEAEFDYGKDRQLLFGAIMQLRSELDDLKSRVCGGLATAASAAAPSLATHVNYHTGELLRGTRRDNESDTGRHDAALQRHDEPRRDYVINDYEAVDEVNYKVVDDAAPKTVEQAEREAITNALARNNGRRRQAAEELKISERTLYRKIKQYGLDRK